MTLQEIDARIEELKGERVCVEGTRTEVYSRIVGYYRSLNNWNKGKREEYNYRLHYNSQYTALDNIPKEQEPRQGELTLVDESAVRKNIEKYLFFYRQSCPNCPPMKEALNGIEFEGEWIDVDSEEGYSVAEKYMITTAPTVIFVAKDGSELIRATKPQELSEIHGQLVTV